MLPQTRVNEQGWLCVNKTLFKNLAIRLDLAHGLQLADWSQIQPPIITLASPASNSPCSTSSAAPPAHATSTFMFSRTVKPSSISRFCFCCSPYLEHSYTRLTSLFHARIYSSHLLKEVSSGPPSKIPAFPGHSILYLHTKAQAGIKIAGININNLRYADDTTLVAESEEELKSLLMKVKEESEKVGLKLNIQKMKIMASGPITPWEIDGETVETVSDFIFGGFQNHCRWWLQPWN